MNFRSCGSPPLGSFGPALKDLYNEHASANVKLAESELIHFLYTAVDNCIPGRTPDTFIN